jgi:hypothetical protein
MKREAISLLYKILLPSGLPMSLHPSARLLGDHNHFFTLQKVVSLLFS